MGRGSPLTQIAYGIVPFKLKGWGIGFTCILINWSIGGSKLGGAEGGSKEGGGGGGGMSRSITFPFLFEQPKNTNARLLKMIKLIYDRGQEQLSLKFHGLLWTSFFQWRFFQ